MKERCLKACFSCPDIKLCDALDDPDIQFLPPKEKVLAVSKALGREVSAEEVSRVESCLFGSEWVPG